MSSLTDKQREQLSQLTAEDEAALARELASIWGIWAKAKEAVKSSQALPEESLKLLDEFTLEDAADEARSEKFQKVGDVSAAPRRVARWGWS